MTILTWHEKDKAISAARQTAYRLLREVPELSYSKPFSDTAQQGETQAAAKNAHPTAEQNEMLKGQDKTNNHQNLIIQGDNLAALKSLLPFYAGQVKCIFIDPPYNTLSAFKHYDDNLEHSLWLSLMYPRLELLREFLADNGTIWITLDDNESHYFKVMADEIFGRKNFINQISIRMKEISGASGGGEDKKLKKNIEYLLVYAKNWEYFGKFNDVREEEDLFDYIAEMKEQGKSWKYTRVIENFGQKKHIKTIFDGKNQEIKIYEHKNVVFTPIKEIMNRENLSEEEVYLKYFDNIFRDTNAQSSIRTRIMENTYDRNQSSFFSIEYLPVSGKNKDTLTTVYYKGNNCDQIAWLKDIAYKSKNRLVRLSKLGTYWDGFPLNNLTKEGNVQFPNGKKPEELIRRIIELSTKKNDLILDCFLGSGTTVAVAHKMNRRYIGVEMGEHAKTHVIPRLKAVIDGEQGGISKIVNWQGGGSFCFCELGEEVFDEHGQINPAVRFADLAHHIFYLENRVPLPACQKYSPLLGVCQNKVVYLLFNGILGDKRPLGGNVLTQKILASLPEINKWQPDKYQIVVYGEACRLSPQYLMDRNMVFKQIPYEVVAL